MIKLTNRTVLVVAALSMVLLAPFSFAQERRLTYEEWYGDAKKTLADHYTGRTTKLRMAIPNTRRGLEMIDGSVTEESETASSQAIAQPGDEVTIHSFRMGDNNIELELAKPGEKRKRRFFSFAKQPRINIRFSHELTAKDMTIENINRWLAPAIDVSPLAVEPVEQPAANTQASITSEPGPAAKNGDFENPQGLPTPAISGDLNSGDKTISELTIQSTVRNARVYIDDAYSGPTPRTIRLSPGIHSIVVIADGYASWEQRLFLPAGKVSTVKADLVR